MMSMESPRNAMIQQLQDTLSSYLASRPALETVLKPFGKVLIEMAALAADLKPRIACPGFRSGRRTASERRSRHGVHKSRHPGTTAEKRLDRPASGSGNGFSQPGSAFFRYGQQLSPKPL